MFDFGPPFDIVEFDLTDVKLLLVELSDDDTIILNL